MNAVARILTANEPWVEYQLDDGTLLRFRFTACSFRKTGKETAQGDPEYAFSQSLLCETHVPKVVAEVRQLRSMPSIQDRMRETQEKLNSKADLPSFAKCEDYVAPDSDCG